MRNLPSLSLICVLIGLVAAPTVSFAQPDPQPRRDGPRDGAGAMRQGPIVTVSGEGQTQAAPDAATVRLGAMVQAEQAGEAQEQVSQIMQRAIEAVKGLGVADEDIQTADLSLYPVYSNQRPPRPMEREGDDGEPRIVAYRASNTLAVKLDDLDNIGKVIDAAVEAGANQLQGVEFELQDDLEARSEALRRATRIARAKAQVLAEAVGMPLGDLVEIRESGVNIRPPEPMYGARMAMEAGGSTPVQPGQLTVTANVTLVYRLGPGRGQDRGRPATQPGD